jgi:4-phosphopantoate---beta-alanine ligase
MASSIPKSHPRYKSLMIREKMSDAMKRGLIHETGLIAHGRGEAFDYLLGEKTQSFTKEAIHAAAIALYSARHPVFSLNGNVVALVAKECVQLSQVFPLILEVNLFHQSENRVRLLIDELKKAGAKSVLGSQPTKHIPNLDHNRGWCEKDGIFSADVVFVPLEDGDRCQALKDMGKYVITIDLNPLSRTARTADITIVDNITRALPYLIQWVQKIKAEGSDDSILDTWNNKEHLKQVYRFLSKRIYQME